MKKGSTLFLKLVILLIATVVLAWLVVFPHFEGRNANADIFTIYFKDPFLAYVYLTSIPFFYALFQGIKILNLIDQNQAFSQLAVNALKNIKYSALTFGGLFSVTIPLMLRFAQDDDSPGVALIVFMIVFLSLAIFAAAGIFQSLLQNAVDLKSESDLTV